MWRVLRTVGVWVGATLLALAVACGESRQPPPFSATGGTGGSSNPVAGSAGLPVLVVQPSFLDSCAGIVPRSPLKRWSLLDLDLSLDGWFGPGTTLASVATPDHEFDRDLSPYFVEALLRVAQERVQNVVADDAAFEICDADAADEPGCVQAFLDEWGGRLYRQPLSGEQLEAYVVQFRSAASRSTPAEAAQNALVSMVLSPYVVLRLEMGDSKVAGRLAAHEIAARLSHFAARRAPDAELLSEAANGNLLASDGRQAQLRRIWSGPQGQQGRVLAHLDWLGIRPHNERADLSADLRADMATQVVTLVDDLLNGPSPSPTLQSLLTWSREPLNQRLASHYGIRPLEGEGFQITDLDPKLFAGVLSTGAFLSRFRSPTTRGLQVLDALLCIDMPPPPPNIVTEFPEGGTPRERITAVAGPREPCVGCHRTMDPIGFALEAFDDQGRLTNFDSSGSLPQVGGLAPTTVANPGELGAAIALSDQGRACAARRYLELALDRKIASSSMSFGIGNPGSPPNAPALPISNDPDQRWIDCVVRVSKPPASFNFTQVGEALVSSNLFLTRTDPSRRVVAFDTSLEPLEHAAQETRQFRGVFSNPEDEAVIQRYQEALLAQLAEHERRRASGGDGGASGDGASGTAGAGGAP
jgi:hypothetical protein